MASSGIAGAIIDIDGVGEKLNPIIKPIMESVKTQQNTELQNCSIEKRFLLSMLANTCNQYLY